MSETQEKDRTVTPYDPTTQLPVIRASVCNREKIAGFKDLKTGHFTEVKLIKTDADLAEFKRKYAVSEIKELYF
ncbi:MAG: aspartate dehydrogenase [Lachnospiraceae bacterium]|nr:aspartate dehydrogenase [Lachnospiraceae bacterium]